MQSLKTSKRLHILPPQLITAVLRNWIRLDLQTICDVASLITLSEFSRINSVSRLLSGQ